MLYSLCKHLSLLDMESYTLSGKCHHGHPMINPKHHACQLAISVSDVEHVCLDGLSHLVVKSLSLCLQDRVSAFSLTHTLSRFVEAMMTRSPFNNWTFTCF